MKKVNWGPAKIHKAEQKPGTYRSYKDFLQKANDLKKEQDEAIEYFQKAYPAMSALLEYKLKNNEPLIVMRPFQYQTSEIQKGDEIDDAFYNRNKDTNPNDKFTDVVKTVMPGTQLMLKSLDMALQEFIFEDARGHEHCINFVEKNKLMTQTNVFEEVKKFLEGKGD